MEWVRCRTAQKEKGFYKKIIGARGERNRKRVTRFTRKIYRG